MAATESEEGLRTHSMALALAIQCDNKIKKFEYDNSASVAILKERIATLEAALANMSTT